MKDLVDWAAVQRVYKQTHSIRATAKTLGISRGTVSKLLKMKEAPRYRRKVTHSILDPYKETVIAWRCEPYCFNGTRIFRELKARGYPGSIGPVYRFLRRVDEDVGLISRKATVRVETPPGDQAQFDWSEYRKVMVAGRYRTVYCFSMILAASRKKAVCFSLREDADAIYEAIQELFEDLGGVTLELLIDNPKALVTENDPRSEEEVRYNAQALLLAKHLGTELNACPCYWPRKKGKIERPFHYIEEQFIKGNEFAGMEDMNRRGKAFIEGWCNEKHTTTQRIPSQHYLQEEKAVLLPLPEKRFRASGLTKRKISPDSFISIDGCKYSVPVKYAGRDVFYRMVYGFRIEVYDPGGSMFMSFERSYEPHALLSDPAHYEAIAPKTSTSIPQIRRDFAERFSNGARYLEAAGRKFGQPTHHARRILGLSDLYTDEVLDFFIGVAVDEDRMDIKSFKALLMEYNSGKRGIAGRNEAGSCKSRESPKDAGLTRSCDYYEDATKEVGHDAGDNG